MIKTVGRLPLLVVAAALLLLAQPASSQSDVPMADLGSLGTYGSPTGINNQGHVAGWYSAGGLGSARFLWTPDLEWVDLPGRGLSYVHLNDLTQVAISKFIETGNLQPVLWDGGEETSLGHLGGWYALPRALNELGEVVGDSATADGKWHAFRWTPEVGIVDLGTLGGDRARALATNDLGWVVGDSYTASGDTHAFLWTPSGGIRDLGTLDGDYSTASAVNNLGQVVGTSTNAANEDHAFFWTEEGGMSDLGTLGGGYSAAIDINESGAVVGVSTTGAGEEHAFLWTAEGGMTDLGTLGGNASRPSRVSNSEQVVGSSRLATGQTRAFLWTSARGMVDLGTLPGGTQSDAVDVNENGQVVGWSDTDTGERHVVVWTTASSPQEQIRALINRIAGLVDQGVLNKGKASALIQKLENAARQLDQGKPNAVCAQLSAFVNQVEAYTKAGQLPPEIGAELINEANRLSGQLCG